MEYDAFTGGVAPGGLRSKSDIRILICYMLKSVNAPLSGDDIIKVLQEKSLANYFEASDALSALVSLGNVTREEDNTYVLTKRGKSVADDLEQLIPSSVRDKAVAAATALLASAKMERGKRGNHCPHRKRLQRDMPHFRRRNGADEPYRVCARPLSGTRSEKELSPRPTARV